MKSIDCSGRQFLSLDQFFELRKQSQLREFLSQLDPDEPYQTALLRYASTWLGDEIDNHDLAFNPRAHLSEDLSAAMLGTSPCIFLGTNDWAVRATAPFNSLKSKVEQFAAHLSSVRATYSGKTLTLIVVPEKDYVIDSLFLKTRYYSEMKDAIKYLCKLVNDMGINFICNQSFDGLENYQSLIDFEYPDTHLTSRNYSHIYAFALQGIGYDWADFKGLLKFEVAPEYLDLPDKFQGFQPNPYEVSTPVFPHSDISMSGGFADFQNPLGDTWQKFSNSSPVVDKSVLILGDSHSSILERRKLTYFFAASFADLEFRWNPCGIRGEIPKTEADHVILEISQRFIF